jgi:CubicO group peptidase (beta-lactamase class C family)
MALALIAGASLCAMTLATRGEELLEAPVVPVPPLFDEAAIEHALSALDGAVDHAMAQTGVPGIAVGVVYKDEIVYAKGFGVREVGKSEAIDTNTVFLLASVSKSMASTVVAKLVGQRLLAWTDPARKHNPAFALSDPYVTEHTTIVDLLSHRSGLHTGAGDLLEDLGFDRDTILARIDQQPLDPFRSTRSARPTTTAISATRPAPSPQRSLPAGVGKTSPRRSSSNPPAW